VPAHDTTPAAVAVGVHGAGAGGWEWAIWRRVFAAAGIAWQAPDLQPVAAGLAATTLEDYSVQVARWIAAARAAYPQRPLALVGASLGGLLAALHADAADALVLVNPMPPQGLPGPAETAPVRPWRRTASLAGTRRALGDADPFAALLAFRQWRDESAQVLAAARAGCTVAPPACPCLILASADDEDVPAATSIALAERWRATLIRSPGTHVAPLLGRHAAVNAAHVADWLNRSLAGR
jgi:pimeloyl-ACP methyl ester carboxylesterase